MTPDIHVQAGPQPTASVTVTNAPRCASCHQLVLPSTIGGILTNGNLICTTCATRLRNSTSDRTFKAQEHP